MPRKPLAERTEEDIIALEMANCAHFNGMINKTCKVGVQYESVRDDSARPFRYPCLDTGDGHGAIACPKAEYPTREQVIEREEQHRAYIREWSRKLEENICPECDQPMTKVQIGRCVYGKPCGHRLYQGRLP